MIYKNNFKTFIDRCCTLVSQTKIAHCVRSNVCASGTSFFPTTHLGEVEVRTLGGNPPSPSHCLPIPLKISFRGKIWVQSGNILLNLPAVRKTYLNGTANLLKEEEERPKMGASISLFPVYFELNNKPRRAHNALKSTRELFNLPWRF